jgi:hypothetical protein
MAGLPSFETLSADNQLLLQQLLRFSRTPIASAKEIPSELKLALVRTVTASDSAIVSPQGSPAPARRSQTIAASELFPIEWTENTRIVALGCGRIACLLRVCVVRSISLRSKYRRSIEVLRYCSIYIYGRNTIDYTIADSPSWLYYIP